MDLAGARRWRLGPRRRTGLAVPSVLRRRFAGPAARRAARCAGAVPRTRPPAHARAAALPGSRSGDVPGGQPAGRAPDQPRRHRRGRGGEHLEPGWRGRRRPGLRRNRGRAGTALPGPGDHGHGAHRRPAAVMLRELSARHRSWPLAAPFRISRGVKHSAEAVVVEIHEDGCRGRAESVPYARYGETIESVLQQIESARQAIANGASRAQLAELLPAGAARNAVDCALWDLEAQLAGSSVWSLLRLAPPQVLTTALTVSLDTRSEEHTSELQSLMRISYAVFCVKKKKHKNRCIIRHKTN